MKKKLLLSLLSLLLGVSVVAGETYASYFSGYHDDDGHEHDDDYYGFCSGNINLVLEPGDGQIRMNWLSPPNWAPGETVSSTIKFKNTGSSDAKSLYLGFDQLTKTSSGTTNLIDKIIVTDIHEKFNKKTNGNLVNAITAKVGDKKAPLTISELASTIWVTSDNPSIGSDYVILEGNGSRAVSDYALSITFKFANDAGDEYQGKIASFRFWAYADQSSPSAYFKTLH